MMIMAGRTVYTLFPKEREKTYMAIYDTYQKEVIFVGKPDAVLKNCLLYTSDAADE